LTVTGADALAVSLLASTSPSMDMTMLFQLESLYQQMAAIEALLMAQANANLYSGAAGYGGLGALGTAAYRAGLGNGGQRLAPIHPGGAPRIARRTIPVNRGQPRLPPPPRRKQ
jgi:hypothetical protein